jgi:chromosome segregation ATPase
MRGRRQTKRFLPAVLTLVGIALLSFSAPLLEDWLVPIPAVSPEIARLANVTAMTPKAKKLFYRQNPSIEPSASFASRCKVPDKGIMLGCYSRRGGDGKIVIQAVTDKRVQGVMEVTAAHEMLHVAYDRLSQREKDWLAPKLRQAMLLVKDQRLRKILEQYEAGDEALFLNELHSHLGTELLDLQDDELEEYYQKYFTDRSQVAALADKSSFALRHLDNQAETLKPKLDAQEAELKRAKQQLDETEIVLQTSSENLNRLEAELNNIKAQAEVAFRQGDNNLTLVSQFEQQKTYFNQQVEQYNERVATHRDRVKAFNEKVEAYKQNVTAYNQIAKDERSILDNLRGDPPKPGTNKPFAATDSLQTLPETIEPLNQSNKPQ